MKSRSVLIAMLFLLTLQPACFLKFWGKEKAPEEIEYDVYGTVKEVDREKLVIESRNGQSLEFKMMESSIKGGDFGSGAYVHVYYTQREEGRVVTMVVEKIN
ncbi:MAG TPA: hypothetical protein VLV83_22945 [Acidobacteriota bacterium]|nr:hypothetical protein [Acidobacteriota bacterium]